MELASCTPEGESNHCIVCNRSVTIDPTRPPGDAPCPNCGTLLWFDQLTDDVIEHLASRSAYIQTDDDGQVTSIQFVGDAYDDNAIIQLAKITGVQTIDIRGTRITAAGAAKLRQLLTDVSILY